MRVVGMAVLAAMCGCNGAAKVKTAPQNVGGNKEGQMIITGDYLSYETVIKTEKDLMISVSRATTDKREPDADFITLYNVPEVMTNPQVVTVHNPGPEVQLESGWGVWSGQYPMGYTKRVRVIGQGTEFVISIDAGVDYVLDLSMSRHDVQVVAINSTQKKLLTPGEYCTVNDAGQISTPAPISSNEVVADLAAQAEKLLLEVR